MPSDETKKPERLTLEELISYHEDTVQLLSEMMDMVSAEGRDEAWNSMERASQTAQKLRQAARDAAELRTLRKMVAEVEWYPFVTPDDSWLECPWCGAVCQDASKGSHTDSCPYLKLPKEAPDAE